MNYDNNIQGYKEQSIANMTSSELLILVFDELVKRLKRAKLCIEHNQDTVFYESINKSREIVAYLIGCLDPKYPISQELNRMYNFFDQELSIIHSNKSIEKIDKLLPLVEDLRNTWKEASVITKTNKLNK